ncbi:MAG: alpha/beta hydrolase family protein [Dermatophilaceae bacterium]
MTTYDDRLSTESEVHLETGEIAADDGRLLQVTWFVPDGPPRGGVVVAGAMATRRRFYAPFGRWLAERGFLALTVDYRGMESPAALRAETGDAVRWAGDAASALEALAERAGPTVPLSWLGHSLGGQALPFARHDLVSAAVLVSAGSGYWRLGRRAMWWRTPFFFRVLVPVTTRVAGYYPGDRLRLIGNLPTGVIRQWGRWCLHEEYIGADVPSFSRRTASVTLPITAISFTDDELLSGASMVALEQWFAGASVVPVRMTPADLGVDRVGHHGFLRPPHRADWDRLVLPALAVTTTEAGQNANPDQGRGPGPRSAP